MNSLLSNEARHILTMFLVKGNSTSYGLSHNTSVTRAVAKLRKEGYVEVTGKLTLSTITISSNPVEEREYFYVKPTQKLLNMKDELILDKEKFERLVQSYKKN